MSILYSKLFTYLVFVIFFLISSENAISSETRNSSAKFHGKLVVVECTINDGSKRMVDFGSSVGINRIDGKRYEQTIPFTLDCKNYSGGEIPAMTLTFEGTISSFDDAAVATNVSGLGVEIKNNGTPQPLNKPMPLDYKNIPSLTAVPVADPAGKLLPQDFTATVKLVVEIV